MRDPQAETRLLNRRFFFALAIVMVGLLTLAGRLAYLQIINHDHFVTLSENNRVKLQPLPPTRGRIFDRNGVLLADNLLSYRLEITPEQVPNLQTTLQQLRRRIEISGADLERFNTLARRSPRHSGIPLRFRLNEREVARLAVEMHRFPGVHIEADLNRHYPLGSRTAHIVGYVGRIDERDMQTIDVSQYRGSTHIGKTGVERSYEEVLRGQAGYRHIEINAQGRLLRVLEHTPPTSGKDIYLTVDIHLQEIAQQAIAGHNGAVVALDPRNGEILALVSMPTYDPNPFINGIGYQAYQALNTSPDRPLFNRALRGVYPPGSTIKPLVALAGLELDVTTPRRTTYCPGFYRLPGSTHKFRCWRRGGHGSANLNKAIAQSCDVYFYDLALRMGIDRFHDYLAQFSLGNRTGVDLPGEKSGLLPSRDWKQQAHGKAWYGGETLIAGIGQGYMLTTPLQLAHVTAVLARDGEAFQPRILYATREQGNLVKVPAPSRALPSVPVKDARHWETVKKAMIHVVHGRGGTARKIGKASPFLIAGKTGTAQVFSLRQNQRYNAKRLAKHLLDHALFVAFAPAENPRIAVAVIAENGGGGSKTAAPIAKQVLDAYLIKQTETAKGNGHAG